MSVTSARHGRTSDEPDRHAGARDPTVLTRQRLGRSPSSPRESTRTGDALVRAAFWHTEFVVPATVIVGAQWGDEGKGKIVDLLAQHSDLVCRYQGGPNAGHTIIADGETYKFKHMPSGILWGKECVLGAGCVVDPGVFVEELDELEARGISTETVRALRQRAPDHAVARRARRARASGGSGSCRSARPAAASGRRTRTSRPRLGIRVQDLFDAKILRQKIEVALAEKNVWLERVYGAAPLDLEEVAEQVRGLRAAAAPVHRATRRCWSTSALRTARPCSSRAPRRRCSTSTTARIRSSRRRTRSPAGAATGIGIGPTRIDRVIGVAKAYVTRVGEGPFPTEIVGPDQERLRELGGEYGTVTGRERRCGWLDLVALRYAVRLNGMTSLALTKLDVLSAFAELPVCVALPHCRDGTETDEFPAHQSDFHHCEPVYETLPGWNEPLDAIDDVADAAGGRAATTSTSSSESSASRSA